MALEPLIAAKARANQSIAGGDKKSDSAKSLFPKCEKAIEAIHTGEELAKLSGISKNTIRRAKVIKEQSPPWNPTQSEANELCGRVGRHRLDVSESTRQKESFR